MKISRSIRQLYEGQFEINTLLKKRVDERINSLKLRHWHYESRVKGPESFAIKIESGRFEDPSELEDFFAGTIVVRNGTEIEEAAQFIKQNFDTKYRRPKRKGYTHKEPDSFPFDDLRLYVSWKRDPALPPTELGSITFELQIKTFLQHAWSVATHDLIYKSDGESWSEKRIAFQIKAMLEHAEVSINEASSLAGSNILALTNSKTENMKKVIDLLKSRWTQSELPENTRGLAENINSLIRALGISVNQLSHIIDKEKIRTGGFFSTNLSPYGIVIQGLLNGHGKQFMSLLADKDERLKVLIPSEINTPANIVRDHCINGIFVGDPLP